MYIIVYLNLIHTSELLLLNQMTKNVFIEIKLK